MTENVGTTVVPETGSMSAGRLLREARERQGLHIAALAASIKVSQKKLESLEADRYGELPDATFTRALAQTVCRALKIESADVLRLLPPPVGHRLEHVSQGINTPFRERPGASVQPEWGGLPRSPIFWITALILIAALAVFFLPRGLLGLPSARPAASAASVLLPASSPAELKRAQNETPGMPPDTPPDEAPRSALGSASGATDVATTGSPADALPAGVLQLQTSAGSWVDVSDGRGQSLVSRLLKPGEAIGLDGTPPLKVRIGNASGTRLVFRGQPTSLAAYTRDNVARLELK